MSADFCGAELAGIMDAAIGAIERSATPESRNEWEALGMKEWLALAKTSRRIGPLFLLGYEAGRRDLIPQTLKLCAEEDEIEGPFGYWPACANHFALSVRWPKRTTVGAWMLHRLRDGKEIRPPDFFTLYGIQCGLFQIPLVQGAEGLLVALISATSVRPMTGDIETLPLLVSRILESHSQTNEPIFRAI